ncbi:MAG: hypothetical protein HZB71_11970 [Betaproteobacteria bacterium]|nr:hypothetical protein [Betaproteobacteria bacterium]
MTRFTRLLGLLLVTALPLMLADAAWSATAAKPVAKKTSKHVKPAKHKKAAQKKTAKAAANPYLPTPQAAPATPVQAISAPMTPAPAPAAALAKPAPTPLPPFVFVPPFAQTGYSAPPNPYLAHVAAAAPVVAVAALPAPVVVAAPAVAAALPVPAIAAAAPAATPAQASTGSVFSGLRSLLPDMPPSDQSILPTIKKVLPTGEKPLYVLTFKCPTELIGITPIPTKALHYLVDGAMGLVNSTNLLPFNMQQVCQ